jgi:putative membrane protein
MDAERFFTPEEKERIERAVEEAEKRTAGEIVPMVVSASASYAEVELAGLVTGLTLGTVLALLWSDPWGIRHLELAWPVGVAGIGFFLCRVPAVKRRLIPSREMAEAVHARCLAAFTAHGLHRTRNHTGILILVSLLEHRVEVLADRGINEKVAPGTWQDIVEIIVRGLRQRSAGEAFCAAIDRCGEILAAHFPRAPDDRNELADKLISEP